MIKTGVVELTGEKLFLIGGILSVDVQHITDFETQGI